LSLQDCDDLLSISTSKFKTGQLPKFDQFNKKKMLLKLKDIRTYIQMFENNIDEDDTINIISEFKNKI